MSMLDDDLIEARLRAALREIAERDLNDGDGLPRLPAASSPPERRARRPLLVAAALIIVAGVIAVLGARGDSRDRSSIILDQSGTAPVRVIPGPLPEGTTWRSVGERTAADIEVDVGSQVMYAHHNGEMIDQVVILGVRDLPPPDSLETRRVLDADGIAVWARDEPSQSGNVRSIEYVFEHPSCGGMLAVASRAEELDVLGLITDLDCGDGNEIVARSLPEGFQQVGADAIFGSRQTAVVLQNIRGGMAEGSWAIVEGRPAVAPFLTFAAASDIETLTIGGRTVHRAVFDGVPFYEWEQGGAVVVMNLGRPEDPSAGQDWGIDVERVIAGSTVVSESEWQAWLNQQTTSPTTSASPSTVASPATSTTVVDESDSVVESGVLYVLPGPIPAGAKVATVNTAPRQILAGQYEGVAKWGRSDGGRITSAMLARFSGLTDLSGQRQVRDQQGRTVWIIDDATVATAYIVEIDGCRPVSVEAYRVSEADALALVGSLRCGERGTSIEGTPPDGYRELSADELSGTSQTIVNLSKDSQYFGAFAVTNGYSTMIAPYLLQARADAVEQVQIAGKDVYRAQVGHNRVHAWYLDGASVAIASPSMTEAEVEAFIAGTRVVSEAEWKVWAASVGR